MPENYPWQVQNTEPTNLVNWETVETNNDLDSIINSFDLTEYNSAKEEEVHFSKQTIQREFGNEILPRLIDLIGARNMVLIDSGTPVDIVSMATDNSGIKILLETGALSTARSLINSVKVKYPTHEDIYNNAIEEINNFLTGIGF